MPTKNKRRSLSPSSGRKSRTKTMPNDATMQNADDDSESTATMNNATPSLFKYSSYCQIQSEVPQSKKGTATMIAKLQEIHAILLEADESLSITLYKTEDVRDAENKISVNTSRLIKKKDDFPSSITALGKYFFSMRPNDKGGMIFGQVHLLHNEPIDNIIADTKTELQEQKAYLTLQTIQHWEVSNIGFLKNLYWDVDIVALAEFFQNNLKRLHKTEVIEIGLKVKTPYDGKKKEYGKQSSNFRDRLQAIHVSVKGEFQDIAIKHLKIILNSALFQKRYSIPVQLIPLFDRKDSPYTQDKIKRCIVFHGQFCQSVNTMACLGINHLDQRNSKLKRTIRELVVGLPGAHFLSIDLNWRGDSYNILFPKNMMRLLANILHI